MKVIVLASILSLVEASLESNSSSSQNSALAGPDCSSMKCPSTCGCVQSKCGASTYAECSADSQCNALMTCMMKCSCHNVFCAMGCLAGKRLNSVSKKVESCASPCANALAMQKSTASDIVTTQLAETVGAPVGFSAMDCSSSVGHLKYFHTVPATPHTGEVFKVTNTLSLDHGFSGGQFEVTVTAIGGMTLKHAIGPVCGRDTSFDVNIGLLKVATVTYYGLNCPRSAGLQDVHYDIKLAKWLPPVFGSASFKIASKDETGADLMCVQADLTINLASDSSSAQNFPLAGPTIQEAAVTSMPDCSSMKCPSTCGCVQSKCGASTYAECSADSQCNALMQCMMRCSCHNIFCAMGCLAGKKLDGVSKKVESCASPCAAALAMQKNTTLDTVTTELAPLVLV